MGHRRCRGSGQVCVQGQRDAGHAPDACHGVPVSDVDGELHDCHKGKLDRILADANFEIDTCKSCHAVDGKDAWGIVPPATTAQKYNQPKRAPALKELWAKSGTTFHSVDMACGDCHRPAGPGSTFKTYHNGYDAQIYNASGQRYADLNKVTIDCRDADRQRAGRQVQLGQRRASSRR